MKHFLLCIALSAAGGALGGWFVAWVNTYEYRKQTKRSRDDPFAATPEHDAMELIRALIKARVAELRKQYAQEERAKQ